MDEHELEISGLQQDVSGSAKLARFLAKLLSEAMHLGADSIIFTTDQNSMSALISKEKAEIKSISLKPTWFLTIIRYLAERLAWDSTERAPTNFEETSYEFSASVRLDEDMVTCRVRKSSQLNKKQALTLSDFRPMQCSALIDELDLGPHARKSFESIISAKAGTIIVVAPKIETLERSRALMLSLTGAHYAGMLQAGLAAEDAYGVAKTDLILYSVRSSDSIDAVLKLREFKLDPARLQLTGILCQGLARRVCVSCGRETIVDAKLIDVLPPGLRPTGKYKYLVGRGCGQCGHSGYRGLVGIQSVLRCDAQFLEKFAKGAQETELVQHIYARGTRPLLEDGVRKALEGKLTFESLYEIVQTAPDSYLRFLSTTSHRTENEPMKLDVGEDFFSSGQAHSTLRPLSGRAAFAVKPEDVNSADRAAESTAIAPVKPRILIVEDDKDQLAILELCMKGAGYDVALAGDGVEALHYIEKHTPDLIISDLMMPNMDGAELVEKIKSHPTFKKVPILILTVISDSDKEYALLDLGADDYCEKTIQRKILLKRVENLLRRGQE